MKATFDGSQESWNQISRILSSFAATYHTPSDQSPYIRLIDSNRIINVGDTVSVDVHITRNGSDGLSVESFIVDDVVYTVKPSVWNGSSSWQCGGCCFEDKPTSFCDHTKCIPGDRDDDKRIVYELIDVKEVE